ncbi:hypothetical protein VNO78_22783 [Psophocarpus tetragonolobus]|uniref:Uncharacterized protein n=1 Tax=Psophocarpus tetragonolobus TaxID=3891 RepID=A0AAN9S5C5_PSOTE
MTLGYLASLAQKRSVIQKNQNRTSTQETFAILNSFNTDVQRLTIPYISEKWAFTYSDSHHTYMEKLCRA